MTLDQEIRKLKRLMMRWRLQVFWFYGGACLLLLTFLLGLGDMHWHFSPNIRWASSFVLGAIVLAMLARSIAVIVKRTTMSALAISIEKYYPALDNRLINYVQLREEAGDNALVAAYLEREKPALHNLDVSRMRDKRNYRWSIASFGAALFLLVAPGAGLGNAWSFSLARVVNPLSDIAPVTRTQVLSVAPGSADIAQGDALTLQASVQGVRGHEVVVEVAPDGGRAQRHSLGVISESDAVEEFVHQVQRAHTGFRYRFRAGDAVPSDWFVVTPLAPPTIIALQASVHPPAHTENPPYEVDLLQGDRPRILAGSEIELEAVGSVPLSDLQVEGLEEGHLVLVSETEQRTWHGAFPVSPSGLLRVKGEDILGRPVAMSAAYDYVSDGPPKIEVLEPQGKVLLPRGEIPQIRFRVHDDYGLAEVSLLRVTQEQAEAFDDQGELVANWSMDGERMFETRWRGALEPVTTTLHYRINAFDPSRNQMGQSDVITFMVAGEADQEEEALRFEQEARDDLSRILAMQKENISESRRLYTAATDADLRAWESPLGLQQDIRVTARRLLQNPIRPLGRMRDTVGDLYANEMLAVIDVMERILHVQEDMRDREMRTAIELQTKILDTLQEAVAVADQTLRDRRRHAIVAQLEALIERQTAVVDRIPSATTAAFMQELASRQDILSEDVAVFQRACERASSNLRSHDERYADLLDQVVRASHERRIREDMLVAADQLEQNESAAALQFGRRAQDNLVHLQEILVEMGVAQDFAEDLPLHTAWETARETLQERIDAHARMQESMDAIRGARDESDVAFDVFWEEYNEVVRESKEKLLEIPTDLHVFMDLNVANELVEDVFSVFQEVEQIAESKEATAEDVLEIAYAKNLEALEMMREMEDRFDPREMWIMEEPEWFAIDTEALDREEMPEAGIALGALASAVEDLISDLHEQTQEHRDAAQDSATTHANPDFEDTGWAIIEGDIASFGAQGKSGADRPDHKEQDGRSNVGRQGMASGETSAGSGTISEGDEDIQARRTEDPTQSGMVQLDGEADTPATGGGKLASGKADAFGMEGGLRRMDSTEEGSPEGMEALMARNAEALFAQASLQNVRVDALHRAVEHLRQADDAVAHGNIALVREHQRHAAAALVEARAELDAPPTAAVQLEHPLPILSNALQVESEMAPPRFRNQVSDYFRILNEEL